ncbi:hypothetical protein GUJ93_ZPchr0004g39137 [Zizania palustris]|nr:hypothetical protein GUJ93_ZPchr0004g39137 [Zizania palustris]KAG8064704.1 hypothetical protein GUJ93_ZPchr0004g39137 [Zizania palustris]
MSSDGEDDADLEFDLEDDDSEMIYNQPRSKSSVVIEEIQEDDRLAGGGKNGSNKKQTSENGDDSKLQLAVRVPAESLESEDDGFPASFSEAKKSTEGGSKKKGNLNTKTSTEDRKRKSSAVSDHHDLSGEAKAENDGGLSKKKRKPKAKKTAADIVEKESKSSVVIEEIQEDDRLAGGGKNGSNKKQTSENGDDSKLQLAVRVPAESLESEDDGFPASFSEAKKSTEGGSKKKGNLNTKTSTEDRKRKSSAVSDHHDLSGEAKAEMMVGCQRKRGSPRPKRLLQILWKRRAKVQVMVLNVVKIQEDDRLAGGGKNGSNKKQTSENGDDSKLQLAVRVPAESLESEDDGFPASFSEAKKSTEGGSKKKGNLNTKTSTEDRKRKSSAVSDHHDLSGEAKAENDGGLSTKKRKPKAKKTAADIVEKESKSSVVIEEIQEDDRLAGGGKNGSNKKQTSENGDDSKLQLAVRVPAESLESEDDGFPASFSEAKKSTEGGSKKKGNLNTETSTEDRKRKSSAVSDHHDLSGEAKAENDGGLSKKKRKPKAKKTAADIVEKESKSSVVIEEIQEDDRLAGGGKNGSNKKQTSENGDDSKLQLAVRVPAESLESEDDGFPASFSEAKKSTEGGSKKKGNLNTETSTEDWKRKSSAVSDHHDLSGEAKAENDGGLSKNKRKPKAKKTAADIVEKESKQQDSLADLVDAKQKKNKNKKSLEAGTHHADKENHVHDDVEEVTAQDTNKRKRNKKKKTQEKKTSENHTPTDLMESESKKQPLQTRTFANGMVIQEIAMGKPDGTKASPGKKVSVKYTGMLKNGMVFDSTVGQSTFDFRLGNLSILLDIYLLVSSPFVSG